jgi:hypothetical protein
LATGAVGIRTGDPIEVRMLDASHNSSDAAALFSIELFDHDEQSSLDICICCDIEQGVAAF